MPLKFIKWIVFSNIWIGLSAVSFTLFGSLLGYFEYQWWYLLLVFFATVFAYNFQRIMKISIDNPAPSERHLWIVKNKLPITIITYFSGLICGVLSFIFLKFTLILLAIPLVLIVLLYAGNRFIKLPIRMIPYVKILAISLVWSVVVFGFPFYQSNNFNLPFEWSYGISTLLFTFALCIPFDIRDIKSDEGRIKTIPGTIGIFYAKVLAVICLLVVIGLSMLDANFAFVIVALLAIIPIAMTNDKKPELFYTGLIDGLFVLLPVFYYLVEVSTL